MQILLDELSHLLILYATTSRRQPIIWFDSSPLVSHSNVWMLDDISDLNDLLCVWCYVDQTKQSTEDKVEGRNFFYAQLAHAGQIDDPKAIKWMASKRETPAEMKYCSGKLDIASMRSALYSYPVTHCNIVI